MPEMYGPMKCLEGMNLSDSCALITDGRFSGSNRGCFVGHVSPEAYESGILAMVENGDIIRIDVDKREISLLVEDTVLNERKNIWTACTAASCLNLSASINLICFPFGPVLLEILNRLAHYTGESFRENCRIHFIYKCAII